MSPIEQSVASTLAPYAAQQFIDTALVAVQALQEHHYVEHELELINILEIDTGIVLLQRTHDCLISHLQAVCTMHRLSVSEDADIVPLAKLVRALLIMQFWEDKETIVGLCNSDAADEDILACLVALVGELTEREAGDLIEDIDPNFLRGLKRLYTDDDFTVEDAGEIEIPADQLTKLRNYRNLMKAEKSLAYRMVKAGYKPGSAFMQYLNRVAGALGERENKDIAFELVPFLLLGRDSWQNPIIAWRENAQLLGLEPHDITAVDSEIIKLLGEYDRLSTQGAVK